MWPFDSKKHKTLTDAVRSGDLRAVRKMLAAGANPNVPAANDDTVPLFYALHEGPEMVRLLIEHGADVNVSGRGGATALAKAESRGQSEVAAVLRAAGARLRTGNEEFTMDPRFRLQVEGKIGQLVLMARINFPTANPDTIAERVEEKLNLEFPMNMPPHEQENIRKEVRALIKKECGVKDYLRGVEKPVPSPEEVMAKTGMSEDELTRRFMEHLIQEGKNPFKEMPEQMLRDAEKKFPDLSELARRKFGTSR
jgi:hypothetical protein